MARTKRKNISKKVRFDVFKRDQFTCQYCGSTPPAVVLQLDHIHPVSKGGSNDIDNLLTACEGCNSGKRDKLLTAAPETVAQKAALLEEKEAQIRAFNKLIAAKRRRENRAIKEIEEIFRETFPSGKGFTEVFKASIRNNFLPKLTQDQLLMAAYKAASKCGSGEAAAKYFCGVCWNIIKEKGFRG